MGVPPTTVMDLSLAVESQDSVVYHGVQIPVNLLRGLEYNYHACILLMELLAADNTDRGDWFHCSDRWLLERLSLKAGQLWRARTALCKAGLVTVDKRYHGPVVWYRCNYDAIYNVLVNARLVKEEVHES